MFQSGDILTASWSRGKAKVRFISYHEDRQRAWAEILECQPRGALEPGAKVLFYHEQLSRLYSCIMQM